MSWNYTSLFNWLVFRYKDHIGFLQYVPSCMSKLGRTSVIATKHFNAEKVWIIFRMCCKFLTSLAFQLCVGHTVWTNIAASSHGRYGILDNQQRDCLYKSWFKLLTKRTTPNIKLTDPVPVTSEFPHTWSVMWKRFPYHCVSWYW